MERYSFNLFVYEKSANLTLQMEVRSSNGSLFETLILFYFLQS
jgi:hypothetical protein